MVIIQRKIHTVQQIEMTEARIIMYFILQNDIKHERIFLGHATVNQKSKFTSDT